MRYYFDDFSLDSDAHELRKGNALLHVEPQVLELLILLLINRHRMVDKEEIYSSIWKDRVVSEAALSSRIKSARKALGDDGKTQKYIKTIHRKGFRFVSEVSIKGELSDHLKTTEVTEALFPEGAHKPTIAVLPFRNMSRDSEEYLTDGITTDIISLLSKHRWMNVIARNTVFALKNQLVDYQRLGKEWHLTYLVEGSVRQANNQIRVTVELIDATSGHQTWADKFDRTLNDIFELQDEITAKISARLEPEIGYAERNKVAHNRPASLKAWDSYHLGIYHFFRFTGKDNLKAQKYLKLSQDLDPNFGEAHAWWAYAIILGMVYWDTEPTGELLDQALNACKRALELDRQNASFYALKARVLLARKEYSLAIEDNQRAIELNPSLAAAHCGLGDSLAYEGRFEDAVDCFQHAIDLSPNDPQSWAFYSYGALALILKGDYQKAAAWSEKASAIPNCQYWTTSHRLVANAYLDNQQEVERLRDKLMREQPAFSLKFARQKLFYLKSSLHVESYMEGLKRAGIY